MGRWDTVAWIGPQLASRGIPTLQLEIEEAGSDVALRAEATAQAIDRLRTDPALANEAASTEVVVIGHSMGGGAALELSAKGSIDGAVALAPFTPDPPPSAMLAPTVVVSCHDDSMTPIAQHTAPVVNAEHHAGFFWADIANTNHDCPTNRPHDWRLTGFLTTTIVDFIATLTDPEGSDSDAFCRAFERAVEDPESVELSATLCEPPPG
jgi:dienelactone hydrolase